MRAFILAAGYGKRMEPLTRTTPKPLLLVRGMPLIEYHVRALVKSGLKELVINVHHLGDQIEQYLGSGERFGALIRYSREPELLETAGGILNAMPLLGGEPFMVVNGDIFTDYDFGNLLNRLPSLLSADDTLGHLVLVDNPLQHPGGDFALMREQNHGFARLERAGNRKLTWSGISVLRPELFAGLPPGPSKLRDLFVPAMRSGKMTGEHYRGHWTDVGSAEQLRILNQ